jgi:RNA polymerase sigma-70 factor (ECF subfamily)
VAKKPRDDRRSRSRPNDDENVGERAADVGSDDGSEFLRFYDEALPHVYGYLARRCGTTAVAEDLCAETFLAAVDAVRGPAALRVSVPWAVGVARHKLVDHWRRQARDQRRFEVLAGASPGPADPEFDPAAIDARRVLDDSSPSTGRH